MRYFNRVISPPWLLFLILIIFGTCSFAQDAEPYRIGPEDMLEINFWQDENLNTQVKVTGEGIISLDVIGEITAAGLTTSELERNIVRQIGRYNQAISQAVVRVIEYNYLRVFVTGQVLNPGRYTFETIPNIYEIINVSGGVTELADLSKVRIIRGGRNAGQIEIVNVSGLVSEGRTGELPVISRDDTIDIPRTFTGLPTDALMAGQPTRNVFYVVGEVVDPGPINLDNNLDLLEGISLAGGPNETADIKNISVVSKDRLGTQVTLFNMDEYTQYPYPSRYVIQAEDVIYLPPRPDSRTRNFLGLGLTEWVGIIGGIGSFVIIADQLSLFGLGE